MDIKAEDQPVLSQTFSSPTILFNHLEYSKHISKVTLLSLTNLHTRFRLLNHRRHYHKPPR